MKFFTKFMGIFFLIVSFTENFAQYIDSPVTLQTNLWLTLEITEIKILDVSEFSSTVGEFYFKRKILGEEVRLPGSGKIERKKNQYILPTDAGLDASPFWKISWNELSNSRTLEIKGYEEDPAPDTDDDLGKVEATFDFTDFEFIQLNTNRVLETKYYRITFSINCAPLISSPSHPDSSKIYNSGNLVLEWTPTLPVNGILGYSYVLDNSILTEPNEDLQGTHRSTSFLDLKGGTYWFHIRAKDKSGFWSSIGHFKINIESSIDVASTPRLEPQFILYANYPNPFNASTIIPYQLSRQGLVYINIYNLHGQLIRKLLSDYQNPGYHAITWEGIDDSGYDVTSGVYICTIQVGRNVKSFRMTLLR